MLFDMRLNAKASMNMLLVHIDGYEGPYHATCTPS